MNNITIGNKELHGKLKIGQLVYTPQQLSSNLSISQLTSEEISLGISTSGGTISPSQLSTYYEFKDNLSGDINRNLGIDTAAENVSAYFLNKNGEWVEQKTPSAIITDEGILEFLGIKATVISEDGTLIIGE